jgi:hypothetical protein
MSGRCRTSLALSLVAACLAVAVGPASAGRLSFSSTTFRLVWPEMRVTMPLSTTELTMQAICGVTLAGTFHARTLAKTAGQLVATLSPTTIIPTPCRVGRGIYLLENWHLRYESFGGTLPSISSLTFSLTGLNAVWEEPLWGFRCLYGATPESPARVVATVVRGAITGIRWDETQGIPGGGEGGICGRPATFSGSGTMAEKSSSAAITFSLI